MLNISELNNVSITDFLNFAQRAQDDGKSVFDSYVKERTDEQAEKKKEYRKNLRALEDEGISLAELEDIKLDGPKTVGLLAEMSRNGIDIGRLFSGFRCDRDLKNSFKYFASDGYASTDDGYLPAYSYIADYSDCSISYIIKERGEFAGLKDAHEANVAVILGQLAQCKRALAEFDRLERALPVDAKSTREWLVAIRDRIVPLGYEKLFLERISADDLYEPYIGSFYLYSMFYLTSVYIREGADLSRDSGRARQIIGAARDFVSGHMELVGIMKKVCLDNGYLPKAFKRLTSPSQYSFEEAVANMKAVEEMIGHGTDAGRTVKYFQNGRICDGFAELVGKDGKSELFQKILDNRISLTVLNLDDPEETCSLLKDSYGLSDDQISQMAENEYSQK